MLYKFHNFLDYSRIFLFLGAVHAVVHVDTCHGLVGRDGNDIEFINVPELTSLGFCSTGHTGKLMIHTEVVLQRDCRKCLGGGFYLYSLLGFNSLVQSVGVTATFHYTTGLLVNNLDFIVINHIFHIFLKQRVGFQQLIDGVYTLCLDRIVLHKVIFFLLTVGG